MTITCPNCKEEHALYWMRWADNTRHLYYRCNKVKILLNQFSPHQDPKLKSRSHQIPVEDVLIIDKARKLKGEIPEVWNKKKRRLEQEKQQLKLLL